MKKYTFEELVEPFSNDGDSEWYETMQTENVIKLLKQVRQATLQECANKARTKTNDESTSIIVDKTTILDLDKDSIEVNE